MAALIRMASTFLPKRARREQGSGFFDGIPRLVAETKKQSARLYLPSWNY
jgi:hypothetical protein